jgi:hypothetical protein
VILLVDISVPEPRGRRSQVTSVAARLALEKCLSRAPMALRPHLAMGLPFSPKALAFPLRGFHRPLTERL